MPLNVKNSPIVFAAFGAAFAYYCLYPLYRSGLITANALLALVFVPVAALCLFWALARWPLIGDANSRTFRLLRLMPARFAAFAAGLALGAGMGAQAAKIASFGIPENSIRGISGTVLDDPRLISGGRAMTTLSLKMVSGADMVKASARGEITVFFPEENSGRLREFGRGAEIYAEGNLRKSEGGNFGGAYLFSADALHITNPAPTLEYFRTGLRLNLTRRFTEAPYGDPAWGGLALALLLGIRDSLDTGIAAMYRDAGCSHILALSGMHLAVLVALISFLLRKPLGLRASAITGTLIILAYCYIVGPLPSLNRAALMYLLGVCAVLGMLKKDPLLLLCMAFLIQLALTPGAGFSLSFILSYLALAGILIIGEPLNGIFRGRVPSVLLLSLSASLGAFIATAGVTAWFFGTLRPVGMIASIILTPLTTVFMIGSMAWLVLNLIAPPLSVLLGYPLSLLYRLMEKTSFAAAKIPGITAPPWLVISLSLFAIAVILWFDHRRRLAASRLEPFP
ncbi:MAG: ComEC/Rec2 family competence protein [Treponema sp.]|jgi:competence protein ComEC|nr:ComEC/Rec2 family competence protein [Treponema sp.]